MFTSADLGGGLLPMASATVEPARKRGRPRKVVTADGEDAGTSKGPAHMLMRHRVDLGIEYVFTKDATQCMDKILVDHLFKILKLAITSSASTVHGVHLLDASVTLYGETATANMTTRLGQLLANAQEAVEHRKRTHISITQCKSYIQKVLTDNDAASRRISKDAPYAVVAILTEIFVQLGRSLHAVATMQKKKRISADHFGTAAVTNMGDPWLTRENTADLLSKGSGVSVAKPSRASGTTSDASKRRKHPARPVAIPSTTWRSVDDEDDTLAKRAEFAKILDAIQ